MKELEKKAIKDLIEFYEDYISGHDLKVREKAEKLHLEYTPGRTLLSDEVNAAVGPLIDIYINTGIKPVSKEKAKDILENLRKREKELYKTNRE